MNMPTPYIVYVQYKRFVLSYMILLTVIVSIYVYYTQSVVVYKGTLLVEIGKRYFEQDRLYRDQISGDRVTYNEMIMEKIEFSTPKALKLELEKLYPNITVKTFINAFTIIEISSENVNKILIQHDINEAYDYLIKKHEIESNLYKKYIMTQKIGQIKVEKKKEYNKILIFLSSILIGVVVLYYSSLIFYILKIQKKL